MPKHVVIIAGEESGDQYAAELVKDLMMSNMPVQFSGMGGEHMQEAGVEVISNLARFGITGISAVIRHALILKKTFTKIKAHLQQAKPDLVILIDCPGFNIPLAKFAKQKLNLRIIYYISPQIWAWKANRIQTLRACVDHMAVIFPFEKKIYQKAGVPVSFVGHPLIKRIQISKDVNQIRQSLNLPNDKKLIALLPGSRRNEIEKHLPVLVKTAEKLTAIHSNLHFVIPIAKAIAPNYIQN